MHTSKSAPLSADAPLCAVGRSISRRYGGSTPGSGSAWRISSKVTGGK